MKTKITKHIFLFLLILVNINLFNNYGIAQNRITKSFDSDWRFLKGNAENAEKPDFDDSSWRKLNVPHDWSIEGPFDEKNPTTGSGGFLPSGVSWYRKHFSVSDKTKKYFIEFDGVMGISDVWINGHHLGQRPSGYISFEYELSDYLNFGKDNVIAVKADTSLQPASRWYTGAGIYRHVRLVAKDAVNIPQYGIVVTTPNVNENGATIKIQSEVLNQSAKFQTVSMSVEIINPAGKIVKTDQTNFSIGLHPEKSGTLKLEFTLPKPQLWNIGNGLLYEARVRTFSNYRMIDTVTIPFGIREYHFDPDTGFWLNGKNFKVKGVCLHHDGGAFGAAVPLAVWERRFKEFQKIGVNAIRTAHNPPAPEVLDLADRMGLLVMDELFDQWTVAKNPFDYHLYFNEWSKRDVRDTVRRDRNHPSVILWSAGNEIHDTPKPEIAIPILKGLVETFHENDPTRPVTQGLFRPNVSHDYENGLADLLDVVGQNYREKEILAAHKQKPTRKIIGTENTHELTQWLAVRDNPEYAGHFVWAGIDYIGETVKFPTNTYNAGLLYKTATWRPLAFQRQSWWAEKPMVYIARRIARTPKLPTDPGYNPNEERRPTVLFSDWNPENLSPHEENVEIYSNCGEVELFLNGKSLGKKSKPTDDSPRNWKVNFETGTIKAVGMNGGKIVANYELKTAGKPAKILLTIDKNSIQNNWDDVVFAEVKIVDENGVLVPNANDLISFQVSGSGTIAAVDSFDNNSIEPFQTTKRKAYNGFCFAMLKANADKGNIKLTATADGLKSASVSIKVGK